MSFDLNVKSEMPSNLVRLILIVDFERGGVMDQLVGALFIWLAAVFSQTERLATNEKLRMFRWDIPKKWIAISLVVIATAGLGWQTYQTLKTKKVIEETKQQVEDLREANSKLFNEASGGTIVNDLAYVVDDEKPDVFVFRLDGEYQLIERMPLKENGTVLTGDKVDDLEAIASADGKLYLITSHSNTKKTGEPKRARQKLLEVSLAPGSRGEVSNKADNLRDVVWKSLKGLADSYLNEEHQDEGMQIEGFAIDKEGNAYIGLRAPLSR